MTSRPSWTGGHSGGHSLPPRREQPDEYDSQSRYGRRDDAIERGQEKPWREERPKRVSKAEREASNSGVWTAALFVGLTALLSVLWVVCAGLVARLSEAGEPSGPPKLPGLYEQLAVGLSALLGSFAVLGSLRTAWLLALAPRVVKRSGTIRRNAVLLAVLGIPFLVFGVLAPSDSPLPHLVLRVSAAGPLLLQAFVGRILVQVGDGRHGTHWGGWAFAGWLACSLCVVFFESWMTLSVIVALLAACCTMLAGTNAWEYYENRIWGVGPSAAPTTKKVDSKRRK
ncbi:MAG: hypothetical protein RL591_2055 [Planctomycetota bacterium]